MNMYIVLDHRRDDVELPEILDRALKTKTEV